MNPDYLSQLLGPYYFPTYQRILTQQQQLMQNYWANSFRAYQHQMAQNLFRPHPLHPVLQHQMAIEELGEILLDLRLNVLFDLSCALDKVERALQRKGK